MKNNMKIFTIAAVCFILLAIPLALSSGLIGIPELSGEDVASVQSALESPSVFVEPSQVVGNYGWNLGFNISDTFQIHINISDAIDLYTWNVNITWNPTILNFTRIVSYGDFLAQTVSPNGTSRFIDIIDANNETGYTAVAETVLGDYAGVDGKGRVVTLEFLIIDYGISNLTISLNGTLPTKLLDSAGQIVAFTAIDGYFSNVVPTGDVNDDGVVDIYDLNMAGKAYGSYVGDPRYDPDVDFNDDDHIDMRDVIVICRNYGKTAL